MQTSRDWNWVQMLIVVALVGLLGAMMPGCKSLKLLSQSQEQAKLETVTEAVRLAAQNRGDTLLADFLSNVPKMGGASGYTERRGALRNPDGTYLLDAAGNVQYDRTVSVGLTASMRDVAGFKEAYLILGGQAINPKTGQVQVGPYLNGLFAYFCGDLMTSGPNAEFAEKWTNAPVAEKQAAADAVAKSLGAWKGLVVEGVTAAGVTVTGVLKEVMKATPVGTAGAAVDAIITLAKGTAAQEDVKAVITAPFVSLPAKCAGDGCGTPYVEPAAGQ